MLFKTLTAFLAIGLACGSAVPAAFQITEETTLADFLLNSPALRSAQTFNAGCFDYYMPVIKGHADKLDEDYTRCTDTYNKDFALIDASYTVTRNELKDSVRASCEALILCDAVASNTGAIGCLAKEGPFSVKKLDEASDKAVDHQTNVIADTDSLDKTKAECQVSAQRGYKANHAETMEELNACLEDPEWDYPTTAAVF